MIVFDEKDVVKNFTYNVPLSPGMLDMMILKEEKIKQQVDENNQVRLIPGDICFV